MPHIFGLVSNYVWLNKYLDWLLVWQRQWICFLTKNPTPALKRPGSSQCSVVLVVKRISCIDQQGNTAMLEERENCIKSRSTHRIIWSDTMWFLVNHVETSIIGGKACQERKSTFLHECIENNNQTHYKWNKAFKWMVFSNQPLRKKIGGTDLWQYK